MSIEFKACTDCYWHRRIPATHGNAGMHVCIHPYVRESMPEDVITSEADEHHYVNCDLARRMGGPCGPRGGAWVSQQDPYDAGALLEYVQDESLESEVDGLAALLEGDAQANG